MRNEFQPGYYQEFIDGYKCLCRIRTWGTFISICVDPSCSSARYSIDQTSKMGKATLARQSYHHYRINSDCR